MKLQTYDEQDSYWKWNWKLGCINEYTDQQSDVTIVDCEPILKSTSFNNYQFGDFTYKFIKNKLFGAKSKMDKNRSANIYNIEPCHIGYSQVTEITIDNLTGQRSYKHLNFSDYVYNSDTHESNSSVDETDIKLLFLYQYGITQCHLKEGN
jgi:hypothetical protein